MKKIYIIVLFFLSGSVLAHSSTHSPINNDFESMMEHMFNQMKMIDMHHKHLFKRTGKKIKKKDGDRSLRVTMKTALNSPSRLKGYTRKTLTYISKKMF